jgi:hypothetical protein
LSKLRVWNRTISRFGAPPHPASSANRRILSQIFGMHSKTGIETWRRVVSGTYRKVRSQGYSRYMPMQTLLHQKKIP